MIYIDKEPFIIVRKNGNEYRLFLAFEADTFSFCIYEYIYMPHKSVPKLHSTTIQDCVKEFNDNIQTAIITEYKLRLDQISNIPLIQATSYKVVVKRPWGKKRSFTISMTDKKLAQQMAKILELQGYTTVVKEVKRNANKSNNKR